MPNASTGSAASPSAPRNGARNGVKPFGPPPAPAIEDRIALVEARIAAVEGRIRELIPAANVLAKAASEFTRAAVRQPWWQRLGLL